MKTHTKILLTILLVPLALCIGVVTSVIEQAIHVYDFMKQEVWSR